MANLSRIMCAGWAALALPSAIAATNPYTYDPSHVAITGGSASLTSLSIGGANPAIQASAAVAVTGGTVTLTSTQLGNALITLSGTLTSNAIIVWPSSMPGSWTIVNNTSGAYTVSLEVSGQATPLALVQGTTRTVSSNGTTLYSPISQAVGLATPTATATSDVALFGGTTGQSLADSGYTVNTSGHALAALDGGNTWTGYQTFNGGTNLAAGSVGSMLVNGDMDIDQQFEGASNGVGIDRFYYAYTASNGMAFQRMTGSPVTGYQHYLKITAPATAVTVAAADQRWLRSAVEGGMVSPLAWGTSNAQAATLSFWAFASVAGNYALSICNSTPSECYVTTYTVSTASTWQQFTITIPAPPTGSSWSSFVAGQYALMLRFDLGSGSTYATSNLNTWQAGTYGTTSGVVSLVGNASALLEFTGVHLFAGTNYGAYIPRPYASELALAKRYYAKSFNEGVAAATNAGLGGALCAITPSAASYVSSYFALPSGMYAGIGSSPSVTLYSPSDTSSGWYDVTGSADVTATADVSSAKGGTGVEISTTGTVATAGHNLCVHVAYNSGFR